MNKQNAIQANKRTTAPGRLGLPTASALVIGSVIGTGIFGIPSALAMFGPISLVAFVLVTIGALALVVVFGLLAQRLPGSGGADLICSRSVR
jgi:APA family basic amino acid/polyamine antiporter